MKFIVSIVASVLMLSTVANARVGTTEQKLIFVKNIITENLPTGYSLVSGTLNIGNQLFDIVPSIAAPLIPGEADYQYVEFRATNGESTYYGWVRFSTDSSFIKGTYREDQKVMSSMHDTHNNESFIIGVSKPVNLHLEVVTD